MRSFTFEVIRDGRAPEVLDVRNLCDDDSAWCHVEALALRINDDKGAFIRVRNSEGGTIIRTGVATALASIEKCRCADCPVKEMLLCRHASKSVAAHSAARQRYKTA